MTKPSVLFICQHNAGRSQLGAHLLAHTYSGRYDVRSGGLAPAETINPVVAESLAELGINTTGIRPRAVTTDELETTDIVITMKPGLALPGAVGNRHVEWQFPDPSTWRIEGVRELRDQISQRIEEFVAAEG